MDTNFIFTGELLTELKDRLENELNVIIAAVSSTEVPLVSVNPKNIFTGYFDPITKSNTPSIFIEGEDVSPTGDDESYSSYEIKHKATIYLVCKQAGTDAGLASLQLYNYGKSLIVFLNEHLNEYIMSDEGIMFYSQLGPDSTKRWLELHIEMSSQVTH